VRLNPFDGGVVYTLALVSATGAVTAATFHRHSLDAR
jgi:hypothetical protein